MPSTDALRLVADWLECPNCRAGMRIDDDALACSGGHRFDIARQGYVNLLGRAAPHNADTSAMCEARDSFLAFGHYSPIRQAVADGLPGARRVVEVGAGTGWYLAGVLESLPDALGLATDISPAAARRASRAHPRAGAVVADTWGRLPIQDGVLDAILCVFAPRNPVEFARILAPGGRLVIAVPGEDHLMELRESLGLLGIGADKLGALLASLTEAFDPVGATKVHTEIDLSPDQARALVAMGPNAFHHVPTDIPGGRTTLDVTVATFVRNKAIIAD